MRKFTKVFAAMLIIIMAAACLTACGSKDKEGAGTYNCSYSKYVGAGQNAVEEDPISLELGKDGKGKSTRNGSTYDCTWDIKDGAVTMQETFMGMTIDYTGTLEGTTLTLFNGDPENPNTYMYVYELQK